MDHSFVFGNVDKGKCAKCKFPFPAHLPSAQCEACGAIGPVNAMGSADSKHILLCTTCEQKEIEVAVSQSQNTPPEITQSRVDNMNLRMLVAKESYENIRYSGDYFNNETIAIEEIRTVINSNEELSADEKAFKFQSYLADMVKHVKEHIFNLDEEKHKAICKELAARKSLRDMEKELRADIRARLKETDSQYDVKIAKPVKPRVKKETLGTYDRLVQAFMMLHTCSREQAEEKIKAGSGGKLGNTKFAN